MKLLIVELSETVYFLLKLCTIADMTKDHKFIEQVWSYYHQSGRDLPWRRSITPYRIVVSEIMLQQTQVSRVLIKYPEWLKQFPTWKSLALASTADVIRAWQGLGYNRRALALKKIAEIVMSEYRGKLPSDPELLVSFPGIGSATASSICAFAFNQPVVFIETNIRRVYIHHFFGTRDSRLGARKTNLHSQVPSDKFQVPSAEYRVTSPEPRDLINDQQLLPIIERTLDRSNPREWYWALMDYGSYLAKKVDNPNRKSQHYAKQSKFEGSDRQIRGAILKILADGNLKLEELKQALNFSPPRIQQALQQLIDEGFLQISRGQIRLRS